jgi:hypothetical protein
MRGPQPAARRTEDCRFARGGSVLSTNEIRRLETRSSRFWTAIAIDGDSEIARIQAIKLLLSMKEEERRVGAPGTPIEVAEREFDDLDRQLYAVKPRMDRH